MKRSDLHAFEFPLKALKNILIMSAEKSSQSAHIEDSIAHDLT